MSRHLELQKKYNELNAQNKKEGREKFSKDLGKPKVKITKGTTPTSTKVIRNKKLDVVIVSVNYNDYLSVTLSHNSKIFDNITVVTSSEDILCQKMCEKFGVNYVVTDIMYDDNAKFNNIVDILDEMLICNIGRYAIVDISEPEKELIKSSAPLLAAALNKTN
jgi:hypothetical protein